MTGTTGRWSFFRDGMKYRSEPSLKAAPATVRQFVAPFRGAQVVVLIVRPAKAALTQIAVTVLPKED